MKTGNPFVNAVTCLKDAEAFNLLNSGSNSMSAEEFGDKLNKTRAMANKNKYKGPVLWHLKAGVTVRDLINSGILDESGGIRAAFEDGGVAFDEPSKSTVAFWVPYFDERSTMLYWNQMMTRRNELKQQNDLPEDHCNSFGSLVLVAGLMSAYFQYTRELVPGKNKYFATDTLNLRGNPIFVCWTDPYRLKCGGLSSTYGGACGFTLIGVEELKDC